MIQNLVPAKNVTNFTSDWHDGTLIGALVDAIAPGLCPEAYTMDPADALENAQRAMNLAEEWLGVPKVSEPHHTLSNVASIIVFICRSSCPKIW